MTGILMSGNCYCPLDVQSPPPRLRRMLEKLQPAAAVTTEALRPRLVEAGFHPDQILLLEQIPAVSDDSMWTRIQERLSALIDLDPAYVIFTSGSTGEPKGVTIPHRGVIDYIEWAVECYDIGPEEILGNQSPFFFDNSTLDLYLCFATGATLHLIPEVHYRFPLRLLEYLQQEKISFIFWVPSVLVQVANLKLLEQVRPGALKKILFAGEVMPVKQLRYWMSHYPNALFSNLYGPTEITVDCTYYHVPADFSGDSLPIGRPCRNSGILVLNEQDQPTAPGEPGELCVRGSSLALGYWHDTERTAETFVQNPLQEACNDLIYRTGDLVVRDETGLIHFLGRKDNQIKRHGYRIELGEIEAAAQQAPGVNACCAVYEPKADELHLFLQLAEPEALKALGETLAGRLPRYMLPTRFHPLAELPLTPNGKINRQLLQHLAKEPANEQPRTAEKPVSDAHRDSTWH